MFLLDGLFHGGVQTRKCVSRGPLESRDSQRSLQPRLILKGSQNGATSLRMSFDPTTPGTDPRRLVMVYFAHFTIFTSSEKNTGDTSQVVTAPQLQRLELPAALGSITSPAPHGPAPTDRLRSRWSKALKSMVEGPCGLPRGGGVL